MKSKTASPNYLNISQNKKNPDCFFIKLMVKPNARQDRIYEDANLLCVDITAPPTKGKANLAIIKLIGKILGIPKSSISLVKGATSHYKIFQIFAPNFTKQGIEEILLK